MVIAEIIYSPNSGYVFGVVIIDKKYPTCYDEFEAAKLFAEKRLGAHNVVNKHNNSLSYETHYPDGTVSGTYDLKFKHIAEDNVLWL